jgi:hypothetical protein
MPKNVEVKEDKEIKVDISEKQNEIKKDAKDLKPALKNNQAKIKK